MEYRYVVSEAPYNMAHNQDGSKVYYCHREDLPYVPVFGSIGDKKKAAGVCKEYNASIVRRRN